jgi:hypothetical protein
MGCLLRYVLKGSSTVRYPFYVVPLLEVQIFSGSGIYSGIFAIYLQCPSKESRMATNIFYALCLLYVLSTATIICDAATLIFDLNLDGESVKSGNYFLLFIPSVVQSHFATQSLQLLTDSQLVLIFFSIGQNTVTGLCDFIAQCIIVSISHCTYYQSFSPNLHRSTVVGSCGVKIFVS